MGRWQDDDWDDAEDEFDSDDDDAGGDTIPCPYCRRPVYEDVERCPYCERYLSGEDAPGSRHPWWVIAGALVCLLVMFLWLFG